MLDYAKPTKLGHGHLPARIFSPFAYRRVREAAVVPIGLREAFPLSEWFPVCWQRRGDGARLVAVRSLLADGRGVPANAVSNLHALPLLCLAHPFIVPPGQAPSGKEAPWIDDEFADNPTDVGAPISSLDGQPTKGTLMRTRCLEELGRMWPATEAVTTDLVAGDLLEPWNLAVEVGGVTIGYPDDMLIVRQTTFDTPALSPLIARHGADFVRLLGAHRHSIFRAASLIALARSAAESDAARPEATANAG